MGPPLPNRCRMPRRRPGEPRTSYGADLTQPAWLYITTLSLDNPARRGLIHRIFGGTPARAAASIFLGSTMTELSQYFWPHGIFAGTFDPFDILAYAVGVGVCFLFDKARS